MFPEGMGRKEFGRLLSIGQVGLEMVVPIIVGVYLDDRLGWSPWATTVGAVLGLAMGLLHLVWLGQQQPTPEQDKEPHTDEEPR